MTWHLTSDGLLVTFNEYQVTPYASEPLATFAP